MFPSVLLERLILVFAWYILPLVYGVELAGLLEDPMFSVGMIYRFYWGCYGSDIFGPESCLGWTVHLCCLWGQLLLTWPRASESGVYRRALRAVFFIPALIIFVAS